LLDIKIKLISEVKKRNWFHFPPDSKSNAGTLKLDSIDMNLIDELAIDGNANYAYLANKLKTSSATISRRIASLLNRNIIKIIAIPNPAKLGSHTTSIIHLKVNREKIDAICEELSRYPEVHTILTIVGKTEIIIRVRFPTAEKMYNFITEKIAHMDGVLNIETNIRAEIKKILHAPLMS
jgi:DNA-binding Lrp family transcriptional regulator